jgi:hypothetical protein
MANVIVDSRPRRSLETIGAKRLRGDIFIKDVIETWLSYKRDKAIRDKEIDAIRLRIVDERLIRGAWSSDGALTCYSTP